ncbi:MAG: hypothetical protein K9G41_12595 [Flavobacteriales bacterium]|nr:hypothetical protein [Flavobacteriales bacterium]
MKAVNTGMRVKNASMIIVNVIMNVVTAAMIIKNVIMIVVNASMIVVNAAMIIKNASMKTEDGSWNWPLSQNGRTGNKRENPLQIRPSVRQKQLWPSSAGMRSSLQLIELKWL